MTAALRHRIVREAARKCGLAGVPTGHLLAHMDLEPSEVRLRSGCPLCAEAAECGGAGDHESV